MALSFTAISAALGLSKLVEKVYDDVSDLITGDSDKARAKRVIESALAAHLQTIDLKQLEVNLAEAQHASVFVAGWRPAVGWVCATGCLYGFIMEPMVRFLVGIFDPALAKELPSLDLASLLTLLGGLLGIGGLRTFEKLHGVERKTLKTSNPKPKN